MLITLEGLDGSGKSTVLSALESRYEVTTTREPTGSWYGDAVRRSIGDDDADPLAELFLYTADHADHLARVVKPALERGETVVSDRYADSRFAYQGATLEGRLEDPVAYVQEIHRPITIVPDRTVYLDVSPETAVERSGATNKFETAAALTAVRRNYERLIEAEPNRFERVDAERDRETVVSAVVDVLESLLHS